MTSTYSTTARSTGRWPLAASRTATSLSSPTRAAPTSIPPRARTATRPSGAWTPPPSPPWSPTRLDTGCRRRCGSACVWRTTSADPTVSGNFAGLIEAVARRRPEHPALRWEGGALTYRSLVDGAAEFAARLRARGLTAGHRLAISLTNRPELVLAVLGGLAAGVTVAPVDPLLKADERADVLADLRPALVLKSGRDGEMVERAADDGVPGPPAALVLYTSGSTGRPKGAVLSHAALAFANRSWGGPVIGLREDDVVLAALPLAHSFGLNGALLAPLLAGVTVRLVERFTAEAVAD